MKLLSLTILLLQGILFSQITEFKGLDDSLGNTHLFYKINDYKYFDTTWDNSVYHYDITNNLDTAYFPGGGFCEHIISCYSSEVYDFVFWRNDPTKYFFAEMECGMDCASKITRFDGQLLDGGFKKPYLFLSKQSDNLIFEQEGWEILKSTNTGLTWELLIQDQWLNSVSPYNDSILFCVNQHSVLNYSTDGGKTFTISDTGSYYRPKLFYDSDKMHIYLIDKNIFKISDNAGKEYSWKTLYQSPRFTNFSVCIDSVSGSVYLADGNKIYYSVNYGLDFNLYNILDNKIIDIYKKPFSNILYAATKYDIFEISSTNTKIIKNIHPPNKLLDWYPLSIGNKWKFLNTIYDWGTYKTDLTFREVIKDTILSNNKKYFVIKHFGDLNTRYTYERIDTTNMFLYSFDSTLTEKERLLDNLTAELGDTLVCYSHYVDYEFQKTITEENLLNISGKSFPTKTYTINMLPSHGYSLSKGIGLSAFGYTGFQVSEVRTLQGCVINGIVYGDTSYFPVGVEQNIEKEQEFSLSQNYPNPFNPTTKLKYTIPVNGVGTSRDLSLLVQLKVYDILGNEVATLVNEEKPAGEYEVEFDGSKLSSGIYFYILKAGENIFSKKMCLIK